jgi:predicted deacylase
MPVAEYFGTDYLSSRELFRHVARSAGAAVQTFELPEHRGPKNESLTIDTGRIGAPQPDRALVILSGTHGVEGFAGSGCQVGFFVDRLYQALPATACALLVHALNPFGFAWLRRVNEDGVDLNRNFVDFSKSLPSSSAYEALHEFLVPADWQGETRRSADMALHSYVQQHGQRAFQAAVTAGQFTRPTGLFYGGTRATWSAQTLITLLQQQLPATVRQVAVLDLHTGLGPRAYGEPILTSRGLDDHERAVNWYGPEVKDLAADEAVAAQLSGSIADGIQRARNDVELTFLGLEFGTQPMMEVLTALRADHWLHSSGIVDQPLRTGIQQQMRRAFYCDSPDWQTAVYGRTADFIYRSCRGLAGSNFG